MTTQMPSRTQPHDVQPSPPRTDAAMSASAVIASSPVAWIAKLAKRLLAHSLNMPEPLLHDTSVFVFAHVQAVEDRAMKTICPFTLLRQFFARRRGHDF